MCSRLNGWETAVRSSFNPDEMDLLAKVIEDACAKLGRVEDREKQLMAARVMSSASGGESAYHALLSVALNGRDPNAL